MNTHDICIDERTNVVIVTERIRTIESVSDFNRIVEQQFEKSGRVPVLIDWTEFEGQPEAISGLHWIIAQSSLCVARVAIIAGENFGEEIGRWDRIVEDVTIQGFPLGKKEQAMEWLLSSS